MKKILALALCLLMVLSMVACGAKKTAADGELPTITLWSSGSQNPLAGPSGAEGPALAVRPSQA